MPNRHAAPLAVAALLLATLVASLLLTSRRAPDGRVLFDGRSELGRVRVVERHDGLRSLYLDEGRTRQTAAYPGRPLHLEFEYTRVGMIGAALMPADGRILFVGLGGGAMPMFVRTILPSAHVDAVEIDPLVVDVAHRYFGFESDARTVVHTGDGRAFLADAGAARWDVIMLDAFSDEGIPIDLATREFLEIVRARLAPGGVVVANLWTSAPEYPSMLATYLAVLPRVMLLRVEGHAQRILLAANEDRDLGESALILAARVLEARAPLGFDLAQRVEDGFGGRPRSSAPVLVDAAVGAPR